MPIPRRISQPAIEAQSLPAQESGVYRSGHRMSRASLHELDEAFDENFDELEEVRDELEEVHDEDEQDDEFDHNFPDIPSLMPGFHADALMTPPVSLPRAERPVPVFEMELETPVSKPFGPLIRTSSTANMAAVRPAPAAPAPPPAPEANMFDSFEAEDNLDIPLDLKAPPTSHSVLTTLAGLEMAAPPASASQPLQITSTQKAFDPKPGIVAFAGFGIPPEKLGGMPAYALRVIARKMQLRDDLRVARLRRIQDISLYESALRCADETAVTKGVALIAASVIGTLSAVVAAAAFLL